jgi:hypothetical protein
MSRMRCIGSLGQIEWIPPADVKHPQAINYWDRRPQYDYHPAKWMTLRLDGYDDGNTSRSSGDANAFSSRSSYGEWRVGCATIW